jgi:hypothetical protein
MEVDPVEYIRRHQSKNANNKHAKQKAYIEEDDNKNPYYWPMSTADKKYAGHVPESKVATKRTESSSTKACDARLADKVVAKEEVQVKEEARKKQKGQLGKVALKTGGTTKVSCSLAYYFYSHHD